MKFALKEWPAAISALDQGQMIFLLRKGGIHERSFTLPQQQALLFPSFEHQNPEFLKLKSAATPRSYRLGERLLVQNWVEFIGSVEINTPDVFPALEPHQIWTQQFLQQRYEWKPERPLFCLLCRVYRLDNPVEIAYQQRYGGCRSWIELDDDIDINPKISVLSESVLEEKVRCIQTLISA
ncbi:MAG: DUF1802 family protein [Cyanobacteria bacterium P01_F01_bin.42]